MKGSYTETISLTRVVEIEVTLTHYPGTPRTWHDPGDPDHTEIEDAIEVDTGEQVELTEWEQREAITRAAAQHRTALHEPEYHDDDDDDDYKPF